MNATDIDECAGEVDGIGWRWRDRHFQNDEIRIGVENEHGASARTDRAGKVSCSAAEHREIAGDVHGGTRHRDPEDRLIGIRMPRGIDHRPSLGNLGDPESRLTADGEERAADVDIARVHGQRLDVVIGASSRVPRLQRPGAGVDRRDKIAGHRADGCKASADVRGAAIDNDLVYGAVDVSVERRREPRTKVDGGKPRFGCVADLGKRAADQHGRGRRCRRNYRAKGGGDHLPI